MSIDKLKKINTKLCEDEAKFSQFSMIIVIDINSIIQSISPACAMFFGYHDHELVGSSLDILMSEEDQVLHRTFIDRYRNTGQTSIVGCQERPVIGLSRKGAQLPILLSVGRIDMLDDIFFVGILQNDTGE